jgi:eukaryotic-like serine/threonine-protein kinase
MSSADETPANRTELQIGVPTITRESLQGLPAIPGYQVLRELGRGGMGVVYEARHLSLDRTVAIKLMKRDDGLHQARFLAEGQIIAAVKHPNVVEVHDFGECSGGPYIAMEYLTGGSFSQKLKGGTVLPPREAAETIAKIAAGVGAAHDIGIVHRDLKPGNVLLDANGNPKVTDFGLAKRTDFDLTLTHEAAGTPSYMAPEQARAMKFVGPPADVWSLGVMLYESLTGRKPFVAESDAALLITIQNAEPPTLRTISKAIPHDLETICLKCLEKEPERRYTTAKEMAADLVAWLEGKPITARRAKAVEKMMLWVRRKPAVAASWAMGILVIISTSSAGLATTLWREAVEGKDQIARDKSLVEIARQDAEDARDAETRAKLIVEDAREQLAILEYSRAINMAYLEYQTGNYENATTLLESCRADLRGWEWHYVHRLCHAEYLHIPAAKPFLGGSLFSFDGKRIVTGGETGLAKIWDAETGLLLRDLHHPFGQTAYSAAFNAAGTKVVVRYEDDTVTVWNAHTGKEIEHFSLNPVMTPYFNTIAFSRDDDQVVINELMFGPRKFKLKNGPGGKDSDFDIARPIGGTAHPFHFAVHTGLDLATIRVINLRTNEAVSTLDGAKKIFVSAFNSTSNLVAVGGWDGPIRLHDVKTGKLIRTILGHSNMVTSVSFSGDDKRLLTASLDGTVREWLVETGVEVRKILGHKRGVYNAAYNPVTPDIATFGADGLKVWRKLDGIESRTVANFNNSVVYCRFCDQDRTVFGHSYVNQTDPAKPTRYTPLALIPSDGSRANPPFPSSLDDAWPILISRRGDRILYGSKAGFAVMNTATKTIEKTLADPTVIPSAIAFDESDGRVWTGTSKGLIQLWDINRGKVERFWNAHSNAVANIALDATGETLVSHGGGDIKTWDARTGRLRHTITKHEPYYAHAVIDPAGTLLAAGGTNESVYLWDALTGQLRFELTGQGNVVSSVAFSPDSKRLAAGTLDNTIKIWDCRSGLLMLTIKAFHGECRSLAFSEDGMQLVAGGGDLHRIFHISGESDHAIKIFDARPVPRQKQIK